MDDYCRSKTKEYRDKGFQGRFEVVPERLGLIDGPGSKRKLEEEAGEDVLLMRCAFVRNNYPNDPSLPKTQLVRWTKENRKKLPSYDTTHEDKLFRSVVSVDGRKYGSSFWWVELLLLNSVILERI